MMNPCFWARNRYVSMWQLEIDATNASSGSTQAGFEYGSGTAAGDAEAWMTIPPSNPHVCSREYLPLRKSAPVFFQETIALCSDIRVLLSPHGGSKDPPT